MKKKQVKVTVADLTDHIGLVGKRPFLFCARCGVEESGNRADYFMAKPEHVFRCCGLNMSLMTKETVYTEA